MRWRGYFQQWTSRSHKYWGYSVGQVSWGVLSALSLGTADFAARFSSRSIGHTRALFGMLLVSCLFTTFYLLQKNPSSISPASVTWLIGLHGVFFTAAMLALYAALAIGPIRIAAPLVASHPALVVFWALANGSSLGALQAIGLALTIAGVVAIGFWGSDTSVRTEELAGPSKHGKVIGIAALASILYALMLITGQEAARTSGVLTTLCLGRLIAFAVLLPFAASRPDGLILPRRWWPVLGAQGVLDAAGVLFLLSGSLGTNQEITAAISATFGAVTVLLAWLFLKEKLSLLQWAATTMIFTGAACLAFAEG